MKKLLSLALALALMLSLATTAFAADLGGSEDVTAKYEKTESEAPVYNVDQQWDDLVFTYSETVTKKWNPDTHTYTETAEGAWDKTAASITIVNHSNVARITVTIQ